MQIDVIFLRGVNLGARNKVPMKALRDMAAALGAPTATTVGNSGNLIVADAPRTLGRDLEASLLGQDVVTKAITVSSVALERALLAYPWPEEQFGVSQLCFFSAELSIQQAVAVDAIDVGPDRWKFDGTFGYLGFAESTHGSRLSNALLERRTGIPSTTRTLLTVRDILRRIGRDILT